MIDIRQVTDKYRVGREKPGGKVYVIGANNENVAAYSSFTSLVTAYGDNGFPMTASTFGSAG